MLGEQVGDIRGQAISTRVLPDLGQGPRLETTDQGIGTLCGEHVTQTVTYVGTLRPNGTVAGEGTGIVMTDKGEAATFRAIGTGVFVRPGVTRWRGTCLYETQSAALSRLNQIAALFEYEIDEGGKSEGHLFEWK
jgi:hypothetical protein